jgi:hypothetical protein
MVEANKCLEAAQQRMKVYYDKHRRDVTYAVNDQVLLSTKYICKERRRQLQKTYSTMHRDCQGTRGRGQGRIQARPASHAQQTSHVFICLLKPFREDTFLGRSQPPLPLLVDKGQGEMFIIDTILDHRVRGTNKQLERQYLIK